MDKGLIRPSQKEKICTKLLSKMSNPKRSILHSVNFLSFSSCSHIYEKQNNLFWSRFNFVSFQVSSSKIHCRRSSFHNMEEKIFITFEENSLNITLLLTSEECNGINMNVFYYNTMYLQPICVYLLLTMNSIECRLYSYCYIQPIATPSLSSPIYVLAFFCWWTLKHKNGKYFPMKTTYTKIE